MRRRSFRRKYKKRFSFKKKFFYFFFLSLFLSSVYLFFFSSFFEVKEIEISGAGRIEEQDLKNFLNSKIEKKILFLKTKNIFLISFKNLKKDTLINFPRIEEISFKRNFPRTIKVIIKKREPLALFLKENNYFLIDKLGILFEKVNFESFPQLFVIEKEGKEEIKLGKKIIEREIMEKILELEKSLKDLNLQIERVKIKSKERMDIKTKIGFGIYFNLKEKISNQIFYLKVVLNKKIPKEKLKNLDYIDLRFGNRIYFKYKVK